jgi:sulfite reductase beta subunit-like hemoprotein
MLHAAGLTSVGACGDTPRNITVCPCSGTASGTVDLLTLARQVQQTIDGLPGMFELPRKFKISFSACAGACGQPWLNDLGFVAERKEGHWGFRVIAAGSLGPVPATGIEAFDWLPADDVLPLVAAALRLFAEHGDREHRQRARLRHVRERLGNEAFASLVREGLAAARHEKTWPQANLAESVGGFNAQVGLTFPNGDVAPDAADAFAAIAGMEGFCVRIANDHRVIVFGRESKALQKTVGRFSALTEAARTQPLVVACPGTRWCSRALTDTNRLADAIRERLRGTKLPVPCVRISGCPNGCAHSSVAEVGLTGGLADAVGDKQEVYTLLAGGDVGRGSALAGVLRRRLSADDAVDQIVRLAEVLRDQKHV